MFQGPGLKDHEYPNVVNVLVGRIRSNSLPAGRAMSWATRAVIVTEGSGMRVRESQYVKSLGDLHLSEKNWFMPEINTVNSKPRNHMRNVFVGIVGSSVLATAARTSG